MDPCDSDIAGTAQACASHPARDRAFDAGAARILRSKGIHCLPPPGRLEGLILPLRPDGECPPGIAPLRAYTLRHMVAAATILG
jgi:hypothetical protein